MNIEFYMTVKAYFKPFWYKIADSISHKMHNYATVFKFWLICADLKFSIWISEGCTQPALMYSKVHNKSS